jgi:hypothetical protein
MSAESEALCQDFFERQKTAIETAVTVVGIYPTRIPITNLPNTSTKYDVLNQTAPFLRCKYGGCPSLTAQTVR